MEWSVIEIGSRRFVRWNVTLNRPEEHWPTEWVHGEFERLTKTGGRWLFEISYLLKNSDVSEKIQN
jgi:hypothetical protein